MKTHRSVIEAFAREYMGEPARRGGEREGEGSEGDHVPLMEMAGEGRGARARSFLSFSLGVPNNSEKDEELTTRRKERLGVEAEITSSRGIWRCLADKDHGGCCALARRSLG